MTSPVNKVLGGVKTLTVGKITPEGASESVKKFIDAIESGNVALLKQLLAGKRDDGEERWPVGSGLCLAARWGKLEIVDVILEVIKVNRWNVKTQVGVSEAVRVAARWGNLEVIKRLFESVGKITWYTHPWLCMEDFGEDADIAHARGYTQVAEFLIKNRHCTRQ